MYKIYGGAGSAGMAPQCILECAGVAYEFIAVDLSGEHRDADYLAINPYGRVPTLLIDGKAMFESAAICMLLADRHPEAGLAPANDAPERAQYLQWSVFLTNTLQEYMLQGFYPERCTTVASQAGNIAEAAKGRVDRAMGIIDEALAAAGPHFLGDAMSVPDIYLAMLATWYEPLDALASKFPNIKRNCDAVRSHPAIERILSEEPADG
jgi:glutathione S-transferase